MLKYLRAIAVVHNVPCSITGKNLPILEPAPQGMGAPQATESTQGNDAETHRSLPVILSTPPRVHLMAATRVYVRYYTTCSHPDGGLRRGVAHRKHA